MANDGKNETVFTLQTGMQNCAVIAKLYRKQHMGCRDIQNLKMGSAL